MNILNKIKELVSSGIHDDELRETIAYLQSLGFNEDKWKEQAILDESKPLTNEELWIKYNKEQELLGNPDQQPFEFEGWDIS